MDEPTTTGSGSTRPAREQEHRERAAEIAGERGESTLAATNGTVEPDGPGIAVGRPETPETPLGAQMSFYRGSSCHSCELCGRPTWYGPRLMEKIAEGAMAACGDCAFAALLVGARPSRIEHLGGQAEVMRRG